MLNNELNTPNPIDSTTQIIMDTMDQIKADLAAFGLSFFQTKNMMIPRIGIQQNDTRFTAILGLSSEGLDPFTRTPHLGHTSACAAIRSPQCGQNM